jgi:peptidoglycan/LPS O-acetylase OafA/YrhL
VNYRADIDGLRALAVILVILAHLGFEDFAGGFIGVDIFFVISGFVITGTLIREYLNRATLPNEIATISLRGFYTRRIKRILPLALLVIIVNIMISFFLFSPLKFKEVLRESFFAVFFLENHYQIRLGADYLASTMNATPLRHLWSLAVEEQFYLFFPLIFLVLLSYHGGKVRSLRVSWQLRLLLGFGLISGASFFWSVFNVFQNPEAAYFGTFDRVWEIGAGCILSVANTFARQKRSFHFRKFPLQTGSLLDYIGLVLISISLAFFDESTRFPGIAALLPVVGTLLIIGNSGVGDKKSALKGLLTLPPVVYLGKISFSLYMWHWPIVTYYNHFFPNSTANLRDSFMLLSITLLLSIFSYKLIEKPAQRLNLVLPAFIKLKKTPDLRAFLHNRIDADLKMVAIFVLATILLLSSVKQLQSTAESSGDFNIPQIRSAEVQPSNPYETTTDSLDVLNPGQSVALGEISKIVLAGLAQVKYSQQITPALNDLLSAPWGLQTVRGIKCSSWNNAGPSMDSTRCSVNILPATKRVLLLGDSHAYMLAPAVTQFYGSKISLDIIGRSGCPIGGQITSANKLHKDSCNELWTVDIPAQLEKQKYDLIIATDDGETNLLLINQAIANLDSLKFSGTPIHIIGNSPRYPAPSECITSEFELSRCVGTPNSYGDKAIQIFRKTLNATYTDLNPLLCVATKCPPVVGNIFVTRDGSHFTGDFVKFLAPFLQLPEQI